MSDPRLQQILDLIQEDVGNRGLRADPKENLITATAGDFEAACKSIADVITTYSSAQGKGEKNRDVYDVFSRRLPRICIVTGFFIPAGQPPCGETDGPLGALFLARALTSFAGCIVAIASDPFCLPALNVGIEVCELSRRVAVWGIRNALVPEQAQTIARLAPTTHLIALERVGPSHTPDSIRAQPGTTAQTLREFSARIPPESFDRCHTMRGRDITDLMSPAHLLFEAADKHVTTIGIGDGGNEIGMGKIPWDIIRRNIPGGDKVACRIPTDHLIVAGISNWGAYGLAAGVMALLGAKPSGDLFDVKRERELLQLMVDKGPLVDGVTGKQTATVDGLDFERYGRILEQLRAIVD
jgi:hypothetical protein